jgi:hypothetical protein
MRRPSPQPTRPPPSARRRNRPSRSARRRKPPTSRGGAPGASRLAGQLLLHVGQGLSPVLRAARAVDDQQIVVSRTGVIVEAVERAVELQELVPQRKGVGIVALQLGDVRAVEQRREAEFRLGRERSVFDLRDGRVLVEEGHEPEAEEHQQEDGQQGHIQFFHADNPL